MSLRATLYTNTQHHVTSQVPQQPSYHKVNACHVLLCSLWPKTRNPICSHLPILQETCNKQKPHHRSDTEQPHSHPLQILVRLKSVRVLLLSGLNGCQTQWRLASYWWRTRTAEFPATLHTWSHCYEHTQISKPVMAGPTELQLPEPTW